MPDLSLLSIYNWRDLVEIAVLSVAIYYWLSWLNKDRYYHLIWYFYSYCTMGVAIYVLNLPSLWLLFVVTVPVIIMLFITMHQQTLQKLLLLGNAKPRTHYSSNWLHEIIAAAMSANHKKQSMICVIERNYPLESFIEALFILNAEITKELIGLLLAMNTKNDCMFWLDHSGKLRATDIELVYESSETLLQDKHTLAPAWQRKLLILTQKTDVLVMANCLATREFIVLHKGTCYEKLTAQECFVLLKKFLHATPLPQEKIFYDTGTQTDSSRDIAA